ncbi:MAG: transcription-repair coupling factor, partial [Planctomycetota bacterium]
QDHGIAKFVGLKTMKPRKPKGTRAQEADEKLRAARGEAKEAAPNEEFLTLEFSGGTKLHVPATQVDRVQKYVGGFHGRPPLSTLGGKRWENQKERVKDSVRDLAAELLRVQAAREHMPGIRFPHDTPWQREFEAEFPYEETEDQLAAISEIKKNMSEPQPMDRLLCGDVGYGKTEVAMRAVFKAVEFGKQAAVLVPTTLLAEQHERTFRDRFADYPFTIESLSRFKTRKEQNDVLARVRRGQVDVLIGTHRLLSKDVKFSDLGIVVVDEEQRFGVEHKQALLQLRLTAEVLTLSATPIPRTLHMSMLGLRDISSLSTAPLDRRAVVTEVLPYNEIRIKRAIERELSREGQVYFVHNRVHNIQTVADDLRKLVPDARIVYGHGQMTPSELEQVMGAFLRREADILVSTTIIESGIDIPTANTMIINNADNFGLADLHQLRGRVGRYKHRAYCYLLLPPDRPVREVAQKRLRAIEEFSMLGAGFKIAMRDLEIRGAGNLLGAEQSGHIAAVGYEMYCRLLDQAARELKNESTSEPSETVIEIGVTGLLPKAYIPSDPRRLEAYRRIASARTHEELAGVRTDLVEAYGEPPAATSTLLDLAELRIAAHELGARSVSVHESDVVIRCEDPDPLVKALEGTRGSVRPLSKRGEDDLAEVYFRPPEAYLEPQTLLRVLTRRFTGEEG